MTGPITRHRGIESSRKEAILMNGTVTTLTSRNPHFAQHSFVPGASMMPALKTIVIGCADPRVDPAHVLGLAGGDALVIRNIGGRYTSATLQTMATLRAIAQGRRGRTRAGVEPHRAAAHRLRSVMLRNRFVSALAIAALAGVLVTAGCGSAATKPPAAAATATAWTAAATGGTANIMIYGVNTDGAYWHGQHHDLRRQHRRCLLARDRFRSGR